MAIGCRLWVHDRQVAKAWLALSHIGYDTKMIRQDINGVFPLERFRELVQEGLVGAMGRFLRAWVQWFI